MFVAFELSIIVIFLILLFVSFKYILLIMAKHNADIAFNSLELGLLELYNGAGDLINSCENIINNNTLTEESKNLMSKAVQFSIEKDGNERIIGFANAILSKLEQITGVLTDYYSQNSSDISKESLDKFLSVKKEFDKEQRKYNDCAKQLKHYVDVFPTSLIARLKGITTMDFLN